MSESTNFTVADLAEDLGIKPASVRVKLRVAEIKKNGKSYTWTDEKEYSKIVEKLRHVQIPAPEKKTKPTDPEKKVA